MSTRLYRVEKWSERHGKWLGTAGRTFDTKQAAVGAAMTLAHKWPQRRWGVRLLEAGTIVTSIVPKVHRLGAGCPVCRVGMGRCCRHCIEQGARI